LVKCDDDEKTNAVLEYIQQSGECWSGGTTWNNHPAIRISICSWRTNAKDIERTIQVFKTGLEDYKNGSTRKLFL